MYCSKCGAKNEEGSLFCTICGERINASSRIQTQDESKEPMNNPEESTDQSMLDSRSKTLWERLWLWSYLNSKVYWIAGVAVTVAALLLFLLLGTKMSWKRTTNGFMRSVTTGEYLDIVDYLPPVILEDLLNEEYDNRKELIDDAKKTFEDLKDELEEDLDYYYDMTLKEYFKGISYEIIRTSKCTSEEIEGLNDYYEYFYDAKEGLIRDAMDVKVRMRVELDEVEKETFTLRLVKIGGKWYVDPDESDIRDILTFGL